MVIKLVFSNRFNLFEDITLNMYRKELGKILNKENFSSWKQRNLIKKTSRIQKILNKINYPNCAQFGIKYTSRTGKNLKYNKLLEWGKNVE